MTRLLLLLCFAPFCGFSQEDDEYAPEITYNADTAQILAFFSKAVEVRFAYLPHFIARKTQTPNGDSTYYVTRISNFRETGLDTNAIEKGILINEKTKKALLEVFLQSGTDHLSTVCYNPRNSISVFDKHQNLICYIEICFECEKIKFSSEFGVHGLLPDQFLAVKELFKSYSISTED